MGVGIWIDCLIIEYDNYIIMGWKPYMLTRLPSLTHSVFFALQVMAQLVDLTRDFGL